VDIEDFYEEDPRRRESEEIEFGHDWSAGDGDDVRFQVTWVEATGEVYAMAEPQLPPGADVFGDTWPNAPSGDAEKVEILGKVGSQAQLEDLFLGWQEAMEEEDSLSWVRNRLQDHQPAPPHDTSLPPQQGAQEIPRA
jgi:hypothetical protein